ADAGPGFDGGETDCLVGVLEYLGQRGDRGFGVRPDATERLGRHAPYLGVVVLQPVQEKLHGRLADLAKRLDRRLPHVLLIVFERLPESGAGAGGLLADPTQGAGGLEADGVALILDG